MMRAFFAIAIGLAVSACATVPRQAAVDLATAGQKVTNASQQSLKALSADVGAVVERQLVRTALLRCMGLRTAATKKHKVPPACEPAPYTDDARVAYAADKKLAGVILLRVKAVKALGDAYGALKDDAGYDEAAELKIALGELTSGVDALTAVVAPMANGTIDAVSPVLQAAAGALADADQTRRLMAASKVIGAADLKLAQAFGAEAEIVSGIAETLTDSKVNVMKVLVQSGLADTSSTLTDFEAGLQLTPPPKLDQNPYAAPAGQTIAIFRAQLAALTAGDAYNANVKALQDLAKQHKNFESDKPVSLDDVTRDIDTLTGWVTIIASLEKASATKPAAPADGSGK